MKKFSGFTVIEILVVFTILATASLLFFQQKNSLEATARDDQRKISINTLYHNLTEIYHEENDSYPARLNSETLPAVPADTFKDPRGITINEKANESQGFVQRDSDYTYNPVGCDQETNKCEGFTLRAVLENEDDFVRKVEL